MSNVRAEITPRIFTDNAQIIFAELVTIIVAVLCKFVITAEGNRITTGAAWERLVIT